jgi:hypothetical protein
MLSKTNWQDVKKLIYDVTFSEKEWITEQKACDILGIQKATLLRRISKNKITKDMYCNTTINKLRFYNREEIEKLKKNI